MKKLLALLIISPVIFFSACSFFWSSEEGAPSPETPGSPVTPGAPASKTPETSNSNQQQKYDIESGMVEYKVSGMRSGTKTVYFKDYGRMEVTYTDVVTKVSTVTNPEKSISLNLGDGKVRSYDLLKNEGTITDIPEEFANISKQQAEQMKQAIGKDTGETKTILGNTCQIFDAQGLAKTCFWNQLPLYTEAGMQGTPTMFTEEAVKLEMGPVPADKFKLPVADSELKDMGNPLDVLKNIPKMPKQ